LFEGGYSYLSVWTMMNVRLFYASLSSSGQYNVDTLRLHERPRVECQGRACGNRGIVSNLQARVQVPKPQARQVSEEAILEMLEQQASAPQKTVVVPLDPLDAALRSEVHERGTPKKSCYKCNQEISADTHVCPLCHTYIAKLDDF
jgi:hypothetical protein